MRVIHSISRDGTDRVTVLEQIESDIKKAQSRGRSKDLIYVY